MVGNYVCHSLIPRPHMQPGNEAENTGTLDSPPSDWS